jgi:uncharacterized membrane protein SirB2
MPEYRPRFISGNPMIAFYPQIKLVHMLAVLLSFSLFAVRGTLMLMRSEFSNHIALRFASYAIDTTLLTAALMLATLLHQYPLVHGWLTAKVILLVVYIVLGSIALKRGKTRRAQVIAFFAACAVFCCIYLIARTHHWAGPLAAMFS